MNRCQHSTSRVRQQLAGGSNSNRVQLATPNSKGQRCCPCRLTAVAVRGSPWEQTHRGAVFSPSIPLPLRTDTASHRIASRQPTANCQVVNSPTRQLAKSPDLLFLSRILSQVATVTASRSFALYFIYVSLPLRCSELTTVYKSDWTGISAIDAPGSSRFFILGPRPSARPRLTN